MIKDPSLARLGENYTVPVNENITALSGMLARSFAMILKLHFLRITNATADQFNDFDGQNMYPTGTNDDMTSTLNFDPETADTEFLDKLQNSDKHT